MISLFSLWLPILLSAVVVFILSSIIHMVLPWHKSDMKKLPDEEAVTNALRQTNVAPGDYMLPRPSGRQEMKSPEFLERMKRGPGAVLTVWGGTSPSMTKYLVQWFLYCVVVSIFAAYIASRAVPASAPYLSVFRFAGATAFFCYCVARWQESIWYRRSWSTAVKDTFDAVIYGLFTGGVFGWLWPQAMM